QKPDKQILPYELEMISDYYKQEELIVHFWDPFKQQIVIRSIAQDSSAKIKLADDKKGDDVAHAALALATTSAPTSAHHGGENFQRAEQSLNVPQPLPSPRVSL